MKNILLTLFSALILISCEKETQKEITNSGSSISKEKIIEMQTSYGKMYIWLFNSTPLHKANFLKLAENGFYNQTTFHRVIPNFMIQGGDSLSKDNDPTNDGTGVTYQMPNEIRDSIKHDRGSVAAARLGDEVNPLRASSGSQFYIAVNKSGTAHLNGKYTVFGQVIKGIELVDSIVKQKRDSKDRPITDIKMEVKVLEKTIGEIKMEFNYEAKL